MSPGKPHSSLDLLSKVFDDNAQGSTPTDQRANSTAGPVGDGRPKRPAPFSLRLSDQERKLLIEMAGRKPLGTYIRQRLFGEEATPRRRAVRPRVDDQKLAGVLSELGRSRIASNLNQLAKSANMGVLDVSPEVEKELEYACAAVVAMREALIIALGLRTGS